MTEQEQNKKPVTIADLVDAFRSQKHEEIRAEEEAREKQAEERAAKYESQCTGLRDIIEALEEVFEKTPAPVKMSFHQGQLGGNGYKPGEYIDPLVLLEFPHRQGYDVDLSIYCREAGPGQYIFDIRPHPEGQVSGNLEASRGLRRNCLSKQDVILIFARYVGHSLELGSFFAPDADYLRH